MDKKPKHSIRLIDVFVIAFLAFLYFNVFIVMTKTIEREQRIDPVKNESCFFNVGQYGHTLILEVNTEKTNAKKNGKVIEK